MTGEQFLNSIRKLDSNINAMDHERCRIADRRRDLLEKAESLGASLTGVCVQHSVGSKTETLGIALADTMSVEETAKKLNQYQDNINRRIDELVVKKQIALDAIKLVPLDAYQALLTYRYMNCYQWLTIADLMGYTETYVRDDLKVNAVAAFERVWQNIRQKPTYI